MRQAGVSNNSTVAVVLAKDLAGFGARRCFALLGTANFKIVGSAGPLPGQHPEIAFDHG